MNIYVVRSNTVASISAGYGIIERTTGGNMLAVEVKVLSFAQVSIQRNAYLRIDGQVEVRDGVTTVYRSQFLGIQTSGSSAHSCEHHMLTLTDGSMDSVLVPWIDIQCQREDTITSVACVEWNSIGARRGETSAMLIECISLADGERFVEVIRWV